MVGTLNALDCSTMPMTRRLNRQDEVTCLIIQWLIFLLFYYKSLHIMLLEGNVTLYTQLS